MRFRRFGRTELQMPVFSCGGMRYQHSWNDRPLSDIPADGQANLEATIRRSLELDIVHIETARGYGTSELQLGQVLPKLPRERLIVQTKVGPREDAAEFESMLKQSFENLSVDRVDLLGIHGINLPEHLDTTMRPGGCMDVVRRWQKQGRIGHVGFSTHGPTDIIVKAIETDAFDYVNLHWYYIFQKNWPAIEAAARHDMGVFIISPSNKGGMLYEAPQKLIDLCAPLSPMVFNNLFCLSHPQVHTLSLGTAKPSDFDEHLKTLDLLDRTSEILPPILDRLKAAAIDALGEEWYDTWNQGLPHWQDVPGEINVETVLWLRNLAVAYDMTEYGKMRYNLLGSAGHWFPGNNAKKIADFEADRFAPVLKNSPYRDRIPALLHDANDRLGGEAVKRLSQSGD
ncbi:MAG: aldo/keto reductase [Geitlerinemataceae cyanobacterium]